MFFFTLSLNITFRSFFNSYFSVLLAVSCTLSSCVTVNHSLFFWGSGSILNFLPVLYPFLLFSYSTLTDHDASFPQLRYQYHECFALSFLMLTRSDGSGFLLCTCRLLGAYRTYLLCNMNWASYAVHILPTYSLFPIPLSAIFFLSSFLIHFFELILAPMSSYSSGIISLPFFSFPRLNP